MSQSVSNRPFILGVDDEEMNRMILEDMIEETYDLELVSSGQACLDFIAERQPAMVLLDVHMPKLDGFEVCRRLKSSPKTQSIPVIFLTAKAEKVAQDKGYEVGGSAYITKPFSELELLETIERYLP